MSALVVMLLSGWHVLAFKGRFRSHVSVCTFHLSRVCSTAWGRLVEAPERRFFVLSSQFDQFHQLALLVSPLLFLLSSLFVLSLLSISKLLLYMPLFFVLQLQSTLHLLVGFFQGLLHDKRIDAFPSESSG